LFLLPILLPILLFLKNLDSASMGIQGVLHIDLLYYVVYGGFTILYHLYDIFVFHLVLSIWITWYAEEF